MCDLSLLWTASAYIHLHFICEAGSSNHGSWATVLLNKVLLERSHAHLFTDGLRFHTVTAETPQPHRLRMAHEEDTYIEEFSDVWLQRLLKIILIVCDLTLCRVSGATVWAEITSSFERLCKSRSNRVTYYCIKALISELSPREWIYNSLNRD